MGPPLFPHIGEPPFWILKIFRSYFTFASSNFQKILYEEKCIFPRIKLRSALIKLSCNHEAYDVGTGRKIRPNTCTTRYASRDSSVLFVERWFDGFGFVEQVQPRPRRRGRLQCHHRPRFGRCRHQQRAISDHVKAAGSLLREKSGSSVPRPHLPRLSAPGQGIGLLVKCL